MKLVTDWPVMFSRAHTEVELLDALLLTVVERFLHAGRGGRRRRDIRQVLPGSEAPLVVVGQQRASRRGGGRTAARGPSWRRAGHCQVWRLLSR